MGIPRFYRWLSERYPLINENITAEHIPEFDNLYLDMNGIIHNCSHNNTGGLCVKDESDVFVEAFKYICRLFHIIRPQKLLYMAIDGCAPRAKMNQQRSRRFRAANDAREAREKAQEMGEDISGPHFDSNCITPGTEFMAKLTEHLRFFICKKIQETPGEGEHKIMDYIRKMKAQPGYDPNQRHCLYGLDADLIMLALASHEPHFALLREEVVFGRRATQTPEQRMLISKDRFQLLHVSLVREYLDLEFSACFQDLQCTYSLERLIDDFILFCVLVGNDFLPCLPFAEIGEGGLEDFFRVYKEHLKASKSSPWLIGECGEINWDQLAKFLKNYGEIEDSRLEAECDEQNFVLGKRRVVGPKDAPDPPDMGDEIPPDPPPSADLARVQWYEVKFGMDVEKHEGTQQQRNLFQSYLEGLQWVMFYYYRGPDNASWSWYYPYYHAPMAFDVATYDKLTRPEIQLEIGGPFKPFQQLMAVLPSNSKACLPQCYQWLFESNESPIRHFYPQKFVVDMDGVKVPWGGMTLIPWIDPAALLSAMEEAERRGPPLTEAEKKRNQFVLARSFRFDAKACTVVASTLPHQYKNLQKCPVMSAEFTHPDLPSGKGFMNDLLPGVILKDFGFPSLHMHPLSHSFGSGIKVFQFEARGKSLIVHVQPAGARVPTDQAIAKLLSAPSAQIDFPFVHRGKVVSVHTAYTKYFPGGKKADNNPRDHENIVWNMLQEWQKRGLTIDFPGEFSAQGPSSQQELWQQPLVEVCVAESSTIDHEGRVQWKFKATSEFRLFHLVKMEEATPLMKPKPLNERFAVGTDVVCVAKGNEAFGQVGTVEKTSDDSAGIQASFEVGLSREEQEALQLQISQVLQRQHASLKWHDLQEVARRVGLEANITRQILGSVMARCADNVREDLGMNLVVELKGGTSLGALCLPCYSMKSPQGWWFSDLAVEALAEYKEKFPGLFEALRWRRNASQDLEQRFIFPDSPDKDYASRQLVKYCNGCAFKRLRLGPVQYMAMTASSAAEAVQLVDTALAALRTREPKVESIVGLQNLYKAEDAGSRPPAELMPAAGEELAVGQRGIYIKPNGLVACGAKGTIIGVYGSGAEQELELILDEDSFGSNDLKGRAPAMRGLQVPASAFMPLFPRLDSAGGMARVPASAKAKTDVQASQALFSLLNQGNSTQATNRIKERVGAKLAGENFAGLAPSKPDDWSGGTASTKASDSDPRNEAPEPQQGGGLRGVSPPPGLAPSPSSALQNNSDASAAILSALGRKPLNSSAPGKESVSRGGKSNGKSAGKSSASAPVGSKEGAPDWSKAFGDLLSLGKKKP
eukprot:TRINITY_DN14325_c0_g2_i3.p1 TRINITY_DN14325_c0_g2~~TRINITY_DN14325_c0_g2_i3.p1  ORF type:complete len:1344 (+),score=322.66 TRINITY_DN14325_c0_g2_i3:78-4034(+)